MSLTSEVVLRSLSPQGGSATKTSEWVSLGKISFDSLGLYQKLTHVFLSHKRLTWGDSVSLSVHCFPLSSDLIRGLGVPSSAVLVGGSSLQGLAGLRGRVSQELCFSLGGEGCGAELRAIQREDAFVLQAVG